MSKPMEWNQPPGKKIVPECVGEISSTKECCAVDREKRKKKKKIVKCSFLSPAGEG